MALAGKKGVAGALSTPIVTTVFKKGVGARLQTAFVETLGLQSAGEEQCIKKGSSDKEEGWFRQASKAQRELLEEYREVLSVLKHLLQQPQEGGSGTSLKEGETPAAGGGGGVGGGSGLWELWRRCLCMLVAHLCFNAEEAAALHGNVQQLLASVQLLLDVCPVPAAAMEVLVER